LANPKKMALLKREYIVAAAYSERAEEAAGVAAIAYESAKAWFEAWRSMEATRRAEMTLK